jgi:hypothetical protein
MATEFSLDALAVRPPLEVTVSAPVTQVLEIQRGPTGTNGSDANVTSTNIASALGFAPIGDAPTDGNQYARKNEAWQAIQTGNPFDQSLNTTESPTFAGLSVTNDIAFPSDFGDISLANVGNFLLVSGDLANGSRTIAPTWTIRQDGSASFANGSASISSNGDANFGEINGNGLHLYDQLYWGNTGTLFGNQAGILHYDGSAQFSNGAASIDSVGSASFSSLTVGGTPYAPFSGAYSDLTGTPSLGSAAAQDVSAFAPAGSYATLVGGTVPASQLPSYVDDVLEFSSLSAFPATGETGKIYTATATNKIYRWSGSTYIEISPSPGSTDAVPEGSTNLYFTAARAVSALTSTLASYATQAWVTAQGYITSASLTWANITGKPTFATVATSGSYSDLTSKPTIPAAQVNSDWNAATGVAQILNKPTLFSGAYSALTGVPTSFTPSAHASSHASGGSDALSLAATQITSGTLASARLPSIPDGNLSSNVPLLNKSTDQTFTNGLISGSGNVSAGGYQVFVNSNMMSAGLYNYDSAGWYWNADYNGNFSIAQNLSVGGNVSAGGNLSGNNLAITTINSKSPAYLTANSFTAGQTITAAANTSALTASYSVTGANTTPLLNLTGTWNTTGVAQGILLNITETASNASSRLIDLQKAGTSMFRVDKFGAVTAANNIVATAALQCGSTNGVSWGGQAFIYSPSANALEQRNGTSAQALRLYSTFSDSSNYERAFLDWTTNANTFTIGTTNAGTGTARVMRLQGAGQVDVYTFGTIQAVRFSSAVSIIYNQLQFGGATLSADPTTTDLAAGRAGVWKNSTSGVVKLWYNDAGTMKSTILA